MNEYRVGNVMECKRELHGAFLPGKEYAIESVDESILFGCYVIITGDDERNYFFKPRDMLSYFSQPRRRCVFE